MARRGMLKGLRGAAAAAREVLRCPPPEPQAVSERRAGVSPHHTVIHLHPELPRTDDGGPADFQEEILLRVPTATDAQELVDFSKPRSLYPCGPAVSWATALLWARRHAGSWGHTQGVGSGREIDGACRVGLPEPGSACPSGW